MRNLFERVIMKNFKKNILLRVFERLILEISVCKITETFHQVSLQS